MSEGPYGDPGTTRGADEAAEPKEADPKEGQDEGVKGAPGGEGEETPPSTG